MTSPTDPADLASFIAQAWAQHAEAPQAVARGLSERAAGLAAEPQAAAAIGLAEHVWLAHLHDAAGLQRFLAAVADGPQPLAPEARAALDRATWVLRQAALPAAPGGPHDGGDPAGGPLAEAAPVLPAGTRWRALQNLWALQLARGAAAALRPVLQAECAAALAHPEAADRRGLAATCHNLATDLRTGPRGDAARDALMLDLAGASRTLWASAGTWLNVERADYQLARCHAVLDQGEAALAHARACLAMLDAHA